MADSASIHVGLHDTSVLGDLCHGQDQVENTARRFDDRFRVGKRLDGRLRLRVLLRACNRGLRGCGTHTGTTRGNGGNGSRHPRKFSATFLL